MRVARSKEDARFWEITKDLEWRLDDGGGGDPPEADPPEFDRGGGGSVWPIWATHTIAFLLGGVTFGWLLIAPIIAAFFVMAALLGFVAFAARRRWH